MDSAAVCHPWVAQRRDRVTFALQAVAGFNAPRPGKQLVALGRLADQLGFDAFFLGDHPATSPECWLHLTAIAAHTSRIGLGPMVAAVPYRPPLLTARLASDLDHLSDGRAILGLGIGWNSNDYGLGTNEFARMGLPYPSVRQRQAALEEALAIIRGAWGPEPFSFQGEFFAAHDARIAAPVQQPGPPLVIAGAGRRTLEQVARLADVANFGAGPAGHVNTPEQAQQRLEVLRAQCVAAGRPYDHILRTHFTHWAVLAPDRASVEAKLAGYFPEGLDGFWTQPGMLLQGTPEEATNAFQGFVDAGMQYFVVQTIDPTDQETVRLLAEEVAPAVRPRASSA